MADLSQPLNRRAFLKSAGFTGGTALLAAPLSGQASGTPATAPFASGPWATASDHGIAGDGKTLNTAAIKTVIQRLGAAGGGTLYFGPGIYLTGPIHFVSNLTLWVDAGATLKFTDDFDAYLPMVPSRWQGLPVTNFSPLLYAHGAENISIVGRGLIDGSGRKWWDFVRALRTRYQENAKTPRNRWQDLFYQLNHNRGESHGFLRPSLLQFIACRNVLVHGVSFLNSPFWSTHYVDCDDVVVDAIRITAELDASNTDGINPESSRNVRIANCHLHTNDDCITIKSGKNEWGRKDARPCENITVTNCVMTCGAAGVGIGSEMSAGVRKVVVSNCVIEGTGHGLHLKSNRQRGGVIEDVTFTNIVLRNIRRHDNPAIHLNLKYYAENQPPAPLTDSTPHFRNIRFSHIRGTHLFRAGAFTGLEERSLENIVMEDVDLAADHGFSAERVDDLRIANVRIDAANGPAFAGRDLKRLEIDGFRRPADAAARSEPAITLHNVDHATLSRCTPFQTEGTIVAISGANTGDIRLLDDHFRNRTDAVAVAPDVPPGAVIRRS